MSATHCFEYNDKKLDIFITENKASFQEQIEFCRRNGGQILEVREGHSVISSRALTSDISVPLPISKYITDLLNVNLKGKARSLEENSHRVWVERENLNLENKEDCNLLEIDQNQDTSIHQTSCNVEAFGLCTRRCLEDDDIPERIFSECFDNSFGGGQDLFIIIPEEITFNEYKEVCEKEPGAIAARIESVEEHEFMVDFVKPFSFSLIYVGVERFDDDNEVSISTSLFEFVDGIENDDTFFRAARGEFPWAPNEPNNANGGLEGCVEANGANGLWNDVGCDNRNRPGLCRRSCTLPSNFSEEIFRAALSVSSFFMIIFFSLSLLLWKEERKRQKIVTEMKYIKEDYLRVTKDCEKLI